MARLARHTDLITSIVLGVAAIGCFVLQVRSFSKETTARETALFNTLQFVITVGFGWFSTRAISRVQFEENLRRFAVSAYRRIADIDRMVHRLRRHLEVSMQEASSEHQGELRVVAAVVEDTLQVVKSSASDWADVIGDELLAIENIKRLEQERDELTDRQQQETHNPEKTSNDLRKLDHEITELVSQLPPQLRLEAKSNRPDRFATFHAGEWLAKRHQKDDGLRLSIVCGGDYACDRDLKNIQPQEALRLCRGERGTLVVQDSTGTKCGRVLNATPLSYDDFVTAMETCYGAPEVSVEFLAIERTSDEFTWYDVRVRTEPRPRQERLRLLERRADELSPTELTSQAPLSIGTT
jgi:hypothetical protein